MNADSQNKIDPSEDTGVADVRAVRNKIAAQYHGDLRKHVADTNKIVEPLIEKLGLKQGVPTRTDDQRSGTEGLTASAESDTPASWDKRNGFANETRSEPNSSIRTPSPLRPALRSALKQQKRRIPKLFSLFADCRQASSPAALCLGIARCAAARHQERPVL